MMKDKKRRLNLKNEEGAASDKSQITKERFNQMMDRYEKDHPRLKFQCKSARSHQDLIEALKYTEPGKEARALHKELKQYGDGLDLKDRYPDLPNHIALAALILFLIAFAICLSVPISCINR